jgi:tRNA-specific 2-thiouridylase
MSRSRKKKTNKQLKTYLAILIPLLVVLLLLAVILTFGRFVSSTPVETDPVTVGPEENLFSTTLIAENCNWFPFENLTAPIEVTAKARYRHKEQPATAYPLEDGRIKVVFHAPQRALTTGQAVVFYDGETVIGGGTICEIK